MTTPNDPYDPRNSGYNYGEYGTAGHGGVPPYPGAGKGQLGGYPGGAGGAGYAGSGGYGGAEGTLFDGKVTVPAPAKPDIVSAVTWGFRAVLANATLWVLGTLVFMAAFFLLVIASAGINAAGAESVSVGFEFGMTILSVVVAPIVLRLMLIQVDKPSTSWRDLGKDVPYLPTIGVAFVTGLVLTLALVLALIGPIMGMIRMAGNGTTMSEGEVFAQVVGLMGIMFFIGLASILIMPLYAYMQWCAADGHGFVPFLEEGL